MPSMSIDSLLGRTATLRVLRIAPPGALLGTDDEASSAEGLLLPTRELPPELREGDALEVFVYLDSEDRPIATTRAPRLELGEVRFLTVTDITRFGAFVDWGLPKELLVPFKEQTRELSAGEHHPFGLILDRTGRLAGTMRIRELLRVGGRFALDEWVSAEAWREEPGIGVFCIIEQKYLGLLPASEPHALRRGDRARFRVAHVLTDGKVELSLRGRVHEQLESDAESLLAQLARRDAPRVGDHSSPEQIRQLFGLSKKAFKRAVGRLLKEGAVTIDASGNVIPR
jgi:uncharacterized protein